MFQACDPHLLTARNVLPPTPPPLFCFQIGSGGDTSNGASSTGSTDGELSDMSPEKGRQPSPAPSPPPPNDDAGNGNGNGNGKGKKRRRDDDDDDDGNDDNDDEEDYEGYQVSGRRRALGFESS